MGMRKLDPGQYSPCPTGKVRERCGSGGAGDCLVLEVADAIRGDLIISDTDHTFRGKIQGHELEALVRAYVAGEVAPDIMDVVKADTERYADEMGGNLALTVRVPV